MRPGAPPGTSLKSLVGGFVLTKQTEGKSPRTVEYYQENLKRFLWYAEKQGWSDDIRLLTEWHIRLFLEYVASETCRWGLQGNGSETSQKKASHSTVHHYFVVLSVFFSWLVIDGFLRESPLASKVTGDSNPTSIGCTPTNSHNVQLNSLVESSTQISVYDYRIVLLLLVTYRRS